jgi:hypothetical protein
MTTTDRTIAGHTPNGTYDQNATRIQNPREHMTEPTGRRLAPNYIEQEMRWKEHVQQAVKRATQVNIALGGLRHLRPEQMRQLYQACVTPIKLWIMHPPSGTTR